MLKKILGESPFDIFLEGTPLVSCEKECRMTLVFVNDGEYDYPASCRIKLHSHLKTDKSEFDIVIPAEGRTQATLTFSIPEGEKLCGGAKLCELSVTEGVFDSKSDYEFELFEEMAYKCTLEKKNSRDKNTESLFSREGVFFGNSEETIRITFLALQEKSLRLDVLSGQIKGYKNGDVIKLLPPVTPLDFQFEKDGSFFFSDPISEEKVYTETLLPKYFTGDLI